jgi:hypothetical protein
MVNVLMNKKIKCSIVQFLFNSGRGAWAEEVQKLYEDYNTLFTENRSLHDELAKMHVLYQELKSERTQ